jgi:hypothetical protein
LPEVLPHACRAGLKITYIAVNFRPGHSEVSARNVTSNAVTDNRGASLRPDRKGLPALSDGNHRR